MVARKKPKLAKLRFGMTKIGKQIAKSRAGKAVAPEARVTYNDIGVATIDFGETVRPGYHDELDGYKIFIVPNLSVVVIGDDPIALTKNQTRILQRLRARRAFSEKSGVPYAEIREEAPTILDPDIGKAFDSTSPERKREFRLVKKLLLAKYSVPSSKRVVWYLRIKL